MEVRAEEEEEEEGVAVEEEGRAFWMFPPNIRLCSLAQLEPFWPFFKVAAGEAEEEGEEMSFLHRTGS